MTIEEIYAELEKMHLNDLEKLKDKISASIEEKKVERVSVYAIESLEKDYQYFASNSYDHAFNKFKEIQNAMNEKAACGDIQYVNRSKIVYLKKKIVEKDDHYYEMLEEYTIR